MMTQALTLVSPIQVFPKSLTAFAQCGVRFFLDGTFAHLLDGTVLQAGQWSRVLRSNIGNNYNVMMQSVSLSPGAAWNGNLVDVWLSPTFDPFWQIIGSGGNQTAVGNLLVRRGSSGNPIFSARFTFFLP